jgi:cysteine-rich repeat protein
MIDVCGDGVHGPLEQCDDGNTVNGDGCSATCMVEIPPGCGDGEVAGDEECDDAGESATCDIDCTFAQCGDSIRNVSAAEACDDGNTTNGDGCSDDCHVEIIPECGDGELDAGEECDDGPESATCDIDCTLAACGDGLVNATAGEQCDDGNTGAGDGCDAACQSEACGLPGLSCGTTVNAMSGGPGSTMNIDSYTCLPDVDKSGPEMVFEWVADISGTASVWLEDTGATHVIVMEANPDCSLGACVTSGPAGAGFTATMGTRYLIIVDTDGAAASSPFMMGLYCPAG